MTEQERPHFPGHGNEERPEQPAAPAHATGQPGPWAAGPQPWGAPTPGTAVGGLPAFMQHGTPPPAPPARRTGRLRIGLAGLVAGALIGGGAGAGVATLLDGSDASVGAPTGGQVVSIENPEQATAVTAAAAKAAPSVVTVYVRGASSSGSGSGVVLTRDGYVLTNAHVLGSDRASVQVRTADGRLYDATVVGTDTVADLAVVKLDGAAGLTPATFADSEAVQVGDLAVAIGAPLGLSNTVTDGIISATDRAVATGSPRDEGTVIDALQTDAAINPGNSGGALVNAAGEVVGINTAIATVASGLPGQSGQGGNIGVGFAIPSNTAKRIADEIVQTGSASHAVLGVRAGTATDDPGSEVGTGAEIVEVTPDGAAAAAGLREGDVVTAVGDRPVTTSTELTAAVRSARPGEQVTLTVRRGGNTITIDVELGGTSG